MDPLRTHNLLVNGCFKLLVDGLEAKESEASRANTDIRGSEEHVSGEVRSVEVK